MTKVAFGAGALLVMMAAAVDTQSSARLLVLNKEDATLAVIDPASGKILGTVPTGPGYGGGFGAIG